MTTVRKDAVCDPMHPQNLKWVYESGLGFEATCSSSESYKKGGRYPPRA